MTVAMITQGTDSMTASDGVVVYNHFYFPVTMGLYVFRMWGTTSAASETVTLSTALSASTSWPSDESEVAFTETYVGSASGENWWLESEPLALVIGDETTTPAWLVSTSSSGSTSYGYQIVRVA